MKGKNMTGTENRINLDEYEDEEIQDLIEAAIETLLKKSFDKRVTMAGIALALKKFGVDHPELRAGAIETAKTLGARIAVATYDPSLS
jgi:hypothetical protein